MEPRSFVLKRSKHLSLYPEPPQSTSLHVYLEVPFKIILPHLGLSSTLFPSGTPTEPLKPHTCHMSHPFLSPWFYHPNNVWREAQIIKYVTWFSLFTCYYLHLGAKYFLNTVFSNTLDLCWSLNVTDKISHPYKNEANYSIVYLKLYIFGQQTGRQKDLDRIVAVIS